MRLQTKSDSLFCSHSEQRSSPTVSTRLGPIRTREALHIPSWLSRTVIGDAVCPTLGQAFLCPCRVLWISAELSGRSWIRAAQQVALTKKLFYGTAGESSNEDSEQQALASQESLCGESESPRRANPNAPNSESVTKRPTDRRLPFGCAIDCEADPAEGSIRMDPDCATPKFGGPFMQNFV